jgi:8-oxo-dGTP pyrophosphatase MutT (NUDIX family)
VISIGRLSGVGPPIKIRRVVRLHEYYRDPGAPRPHDVLPAAFAAVRNAVGDVLLVRRIDDGNWELPGGRVEVGETAGTAVVREVAEESGISIALTALSGVYSDPTHVLVDPDGSIHQQLALCFHAVPVDGGAPRPDGTETDGAAWYDPAATADLTMHPAMRLRLRDAVTAPQRTHFD